MIHEVHIFRASTIQNPLPRWKLLSKIAVSNCEPIMTLIYFNSVKCRQTNGNNQLNPYAQRNEKKRQFKISINEAHILRAPSKTHFQGESYCRKLHLLIFPPNILRHLQKSHMGQEWHNCKKSSQAKSVVSANFAVEKWAPKSV